MSRTKDHVIDRMNIEGPLCMSEAELLALEEQHDTIIAAGRQVWHHLTYCDKGDQKTLDSLDTLLRYIGVYHEVTGEGASSSPTQTAGEMSCTAGDPPF